MARPGGIAATHAPAHETVPHRAERLGVTSRLTMGWHDSAEPASLHAHLDRYGPVPQQGTGRHATLIDAEIGRASCRERVLLGV